MTFLVPSMPVILIDFFGSIVMIILSFMCVGKAQKLRARDEHNIVWTYLLWLSWGLAVFAVSRSGGHIIKQLLVMSGHTATWGTLRPYSGAINTSVFFVAGSVTLFFERVFRINRRILADKAELQESKEQLLYLNQNLENLVAARTQALALSEHRYRRIFEVSRDLILVTNRNGEILDCNPASKKALNSFGDNDAEHKPSIQRSFDNTRQWDSILQGLEEKGFVLNEEAVLMRHDGATMRVLISAGLDQGEDQTQDTIHFLIRDIEQKKLMEARMAQADKLASIGELSSGIAHEINNPLGIILGYTQLLLRNEDPENERHADLRIIEKHVKSCKVIVEDLLSFARGGETMKEPTDLHEVIDEVLQFLHHEPGRQDLAIAKEYSLDLPLAHVDKKKIRQVIMNLVINASHAVEGRGKILLATDFNPEKGLASIWVKDNGPGIPKQNLARIFDPFFTTKPTGQGTGLGLSVSYGIIKSHGGDISVESAPGEGAAFHITLPVEPLESDIED
ncbi:PAS domain S-box-containing protein [Desulfatibacillum alkenivorans DSM 16219]|jgi:PAS domain S-box-containing protein|uniref:histidine kinase n=1 Tax=Desulfatibacillum alkenivorans DSM 16219 TaxID=1121393 RepID=A0A1M6TDX3_9BACT|nr:ATP-binding protein [Desulfatibacillum alkenivorans]SHK54978.1 PAS domain S-box-containing protein [Desulfatibacillum alkenivorans DSM 16219]